MPHYHPKPILPAVSNIRFAKPHSLSHHSSALSRRLWATRVNYHLKSLRPGHQWLCSYSSNHTLISDW